MSSHCTSYYNTDQVLVNAFTCPKPDGDAAAVFCCGFNDIKYCCDDPNSFFPYEYGYMFWLSIGALVGLSIAAVVLLAFLITLCVLCYLFITTKPKGLDNGLTLQVSGFERSAQEGPSQPAAPSGPQGFRKHFFKSKLDCDDQPADPERLFQRCFVATVNTINMEGQS
ncbi:protein shisa-like-2A [Brachyhypopomus gauderio]|uniref:protein shisa-like-2A n=1 Tax=Brachyhypopomus gauderio TaxID=698409 RepID=UPI0040421AD5